MSMFDKLKNIFKGAEPPQPLPAEAFKQAKKERKAKEQPPLTPKEAATLAGEPYISIVKVNLDPNNINAGEFELDWNSKFAANLARAGYQMRPGESEDVIVDRWFKEVCRNVVLEVYEQDMADPRNREMERLQEELRQIRSRDIGNGRSEIS